MADIKSIKVNGNLTVNNDVSIGSNLAVSGSITGNNTFTGVNTFKAPTNSSGTEQITTKFLTSNGGSLKIGKEGPNSGTMLRFDQVDGTCRLRFRASATAGAMVWEQPEKNATLFFDMGNSAGNGKNRITLRNVEGTLALTKELPPTVTANPSGTSTGDLTSIKIGSTIYSIPKGSTSTGDVTAAGNNIFTGSNTFSNNVTLKGSKVTIEQSGDTMNYVGDLDWNSIKLFNVNDGEGLTYIFPYESGADAAGTTRTIASLEAKNRFTGTNTFGSTDTHIIKITEDGQHITGGNLSNAIKGLDIDFYNSKIKFRDARGATVGTTVQANMGVGYGSTEVSLTLPNKTGNIVGDATDNTFTGKNIFKEGKFVVNSSGTAGYNFSVDQYCLKWTGLQPKDADGTQRYYPTTYLYFPASPDTENKTFYYQFPLKKTTTSPVNIVTENEDNTFTGINTFKENIKIISSAAGTSVSSTLAAGDLSVTGLSELNAGGTTSLTPKYLQFSIGAYITAYKYNSIVYNSVSTGKSLTLNFPNINSTSYETIATLPQIQRLERDPSKIYISYKGDFNFSNFKKENNTSTMSVNWGDGYVTTHIISSELTHTYNTYEKSNVHLISIDNATTFGTTIPASSFAGTSSTSTNIYSFEADTNITTIGDNAFEYCRYLKKVELKSVISIGKNAFAYCDSLTEITLPNVVTIGSGAFMNAYNLVNVYVPKAQSLGTSCFNNCNKLQRVIFISRIN